MADFLILIILAGVAGAVVVTYGDEIGAWMRKRLGW